MRDSAVGLAPNMLPDVVESFGGYMLYGGLASKNNGIVKKVYGWQREVAPNQTDLDMETAGVAAWGVDTAGTQNSKQGNAYKGLLCKRTARISGAAAGIWGNKAVHGMLAGCRYAYTGVARSDGNTIPGLFVGMENVWSGTTSTLWQNFYLEGTVTTPYLGFIDSHATEIGQYIEFDDMYGSNLSLNKVDFYVSPISNPIIQSTYVNQPWHTTVNGINAINFGTAITDRRTANFTNPIVQNTNQTVYMVVNKKVSSSSPKAIFNRTLGTNPGIYLDGGGTDKAYIYSDANYRCESACAVGVRLIRYRNTATSISLKVDSVAEAAYSAVAPVLGTWTGIGTTIVNQAPCSDILALIIINQDLPTTYPALDLYIRQSLARLCNCTAGVPVT